MLRNLSTYRRTIAASSAFAAILLAAVLLAGVRLQSNAVSAAEPEAATWYRCTPANVAVFASRIHIKCTAAAPGGILYFAYPARDTANASRFLSLLTSAEVAGKQVDVLYDPADTSGASFGCATGDCRTISGVALLP